MSTRVALLLVLATFLVGQAAPAPAKHAKQIYKCCRETKLNEFKKAAKISSLEACKLFCKKKEYGQPVWRATGWGCVVDSLLHDCEEVEQKLCDDMVQAAQKNFYRMYSISFSVTKEENTVRKIRKGGSSTVREVDNDSSDFTGVVAGGKRSGTKKRRGGAVTLTVAKNEENINNTLITSRASNFDKKGLSPGRFNLGSDGGMVFEETRLVREGRIFKDKESDLTDKIKEKESRIIVSGFGSLLSKTLVTGTERVQERDTQNNTNNATVDKTSVAADGTAKLNLKEVVGTNSAISTPEGPARRALRIVGNSSESTMGALDRVKRFQLNKRSRTSLLGDDDHSKSTTTVDKTKGTTTLVGNRNHSSEGTTDRTRVESDVGSIDTTNNRTSGAANNRTQTERLVDGTKEIAKTSSCPGCEAEHNEIIERGTVTRDDLRARSHFNITGAFTDIKAKDGQRLRLVGATGTNVNGTLLRRNEEGEERRTRGGSSTAGCKKGSKKCDYSSSNTGVTVVRSKNDTIVEEDIVRKTNKISTASYGG